MADVFADDRTDTTDVLIVRSEAHTVDAPEFESFLREFLEKSETAALRSARSYLDGNSEDLVSDDRHATIVPLSMIEDPVEDVLAEVAALERGGAFAVAVTGDETLDHDFNVLSQEDLEKGELQFGLPAALIILLLVFGAVVAGRSRCSWRSSRSSSRSACRRSLPSSSSCRSSS